MNHVQRKSILLVIQGMKQQLGLLESLISLKEEAEEDPGVSRYRPEPVNSRYTSSEEDDMIERAFDHERLVLEKESTLMQNVLKTAHDEQA